ncbi:MAG: Ferredoxin--NADP reductase [Candidatus Anoxychlamydiales bacterium]|nr:Ferredoxin--NADP reductase [Candidatus Anoxychlamydiales bacterium]
MYDLIVIGAGPSGIFASIFFKKNNKSAKVLILEKTDIVLHKVKISGGGRCNVTNIENDPKILVKNYPRGYKELLSCFYKFNTKDTINFFENKNIKLKSQVDGRVFPQSNNSMSIVNALLDEIDKLNIEIKKNQSVVNIKKENDLFEINTNNEKFLAKNLLIATGSSKMGYEFAKIFDHTIIEPIPSLFTFNCKNFLLKDLSGVAIKDAMVKIVDSKFYQLGDLLITHFGFSGPCILKLSAFAARYIFEKKYIFKISINWLGELNFENILNKLIEFKKKNPNQKLLQNNIFNLPKNLSKHFLKSLKIIDKKLIEISKKDLINLSNKLTNDIYQINTKSLNKQEFVTCGGIKLNEVDFKTMQSKKTKNLYFAGEVLDIDGITGGFNFQNAFTTGYIAGTSMKTNDNNQNT